MTGIELINFILENNAEDLPVEIQYRDSGGLYVGTEKEFIYPMVVEANAKEVYLEPENYRRIVL